MKSIVLAIGLLVPGLCSAQQYQINWYKIAGGGGTASNGVYLIRDTIGQHDAGGPLTGGSYSLTSGFWAVSAIQTPGAPRLRLFLSATNSVVVAWPAPSPGYRLQQTAEIGQPNWSNVMDPVIVVNGENQVTISPPVGNWFYRLVNP